MLKVLVVLNKNHTQLVTMSLWNLNNLNYNKAQSFPILQQRVWSPSNPSRVWFFNALSNSVQNANNTVMALSILRKHPLSCQMRVSQKHSNSLKEKSKRSMIPSRKLFVLSKSKLIHIITMSILLQNSRDVKLQAPFTILKKSSRLIINSADEWVEDQNLKPFIY